MNKIKGTDNQRNG